MTEFKIEHLIKTINPDKRFDLYLKSIGVHLSRTRISNLIERGDATVNGKIEKSSYKVKTGDVIAVHYKTLTNDDIEPQKIDLDVLYEDDQLIVINKSKHMVVHPAKGNRDGTMVNALLYHTKIEGGEKSRPGVVHRLDKDTTGVMVFAKNENAHAFLAGQIESRSMERTYLSIVWGNILRKQGIINAPIGRSNSNRKLMTVTNINSKEATTNYKLIKSFEVATLLKLKLNTGRTHQIRVHMSYLGHPVVGDYDYCKNIPAVLKNVSVDKRRHYDSIINLIDRQALHSASLSFIHPSTEERMTFYAPIPEDFMSVLNYLYMIENQ